MKLTTLFLSLILAGHAYAGERAVVQQMKGRRAIIQFEKDIPFSVGQKVYLSSEDGTELGIRKELRNPLERKNLIGLTTAFENQEYEVKSGSTKVKTTVTAYEVAARYGWNMEQYEFGPLATMSYSKQKGGSESSRYTIGGFFDFNLIPNKPGEDFIFGAYGEGSIGNTKAASVSRSLTNLTGGGFVKWFFLSPMLAFRANLYYSYEMQSNDATQTSTGLGVGLSHYF